MMKTRARLEKLYAPLTAHERALLVLQAWKDDEEQDLRIQATMPREQEQEFDRLLYLMNGCNGALARHAVYLSALVEQLSLRFGWLAALRVWALRDIQLALSMSRVLREPITKSEFEQRSREERRKMIALSKAAEIVAERRLESISDGDEDVSDAGWKRLVTRTKSEITKLVRDGSIQGKAKARTVSVNTGALFDWLGEPVPIRSTVGLAYETRPDSESAHVTQAREEMHRMLAALSDSSASQVLLAYGQSNDNGGEPPFVQAISKVLAERLTEGIERYWKRLLAIEIVVQEVMTEFSGNDPLLPEIRAGVTGIRDELTRIHKGLADFGVNAQLTDPDEDARRLVRRFAFGDSEAAPTRGRDFA